MQICRLRRRRRDFSDRGRDGATFQNKAETARLRNNYLRPWWMRRDHSNQSGESPDLGRTFQNVARLSRTRRRRRHFPYRGGDGATKNQFFATKAEMTRFSGPKRRRREFSDRGGDGATKIIFLATEVDTVRLSRPRQRRRNFSDQETAQLFSPRRRRRDFPEQGGGGASFQTNGKTVRQTIYSSRPSGDGAIFLEQRI